MKILAIVLYTAAFLLQVYGLVGVVRDVRRNISDSSVLLAKLQEALATGWPDPVAGVLAEHSISHNKLNERREWTNVIVLVLGVLVGFGGNIVAACA